MKATALSPLALAGHTLGAPQVMGAVRLVPVLRHEAPGDLRIALRDYGPSVGFVGLDSRPEEPGLEYIGYIPHGLIVSHTKDGTSASLGAILGERQKGQFFQLHHRMVKAEAADDGPARLRLLPLHLAMEGFLSLQFSGPSVLWSEYSDHARRRGLDPRIEKSVRGTFLTGLAEALAIFELHPKQTGVLLFVADALATAFVVSHPDDYRRLHTSLLEDFFGELLYTYAILHPTPNDVHVAVDPSRVTSFDSLDAEIARVRSAWAGQSAFLADGLFGRAIRVEEVRSMPPFRLERFMPKFDPSDECHIGERIVRSDGTLEYLKTFRLSHAQVRRAHLLETLASADWNLDDAAALLRCPKSELIVRLVNAGFGYLLRPHLVEGLPDTSAKA